MKKRTVMVVVRLPNQLISEINRMAKLQGGTRSSVIRSALEAANKDGEAALMARHVTWLKSREAGKLMNGAADRIDAFCKWLGETVTAAQQLAHDLQATTETENK